MKGPVCPVMNEKKGHGAGGGACPFISSTHTDPSLDFFEVAFPVKYKKKYAHYLNQRIFYDIKQVE
jgi:hypothetical protein